MPALANRYAVLSPPSVPKLIVAVSSTTIRRAGLNCGYTVAPSAGRINDDPSSLSTTPMSKAPSVILLVDLIVSSVAPILSSTKPGIKFCGPMY